MSEMSATSVVHRSETWDATAADYEMLAEPFTRQYAETALALAGGVRPGERVLDVAAGTGALTLAAARAGARVLATDFSPGMVARLSARLRAEGFDRSGCAARVMDGQALELPEASVDAAFSIFGVMLFPDHRKGLAELARVLRPGGRACVAVWTREEGAGPALVLVEAFRALFPDRELPPFPPGMVRLKHAAALVEDMRGGPARGDRDHRHRCVDGAVRGLGGGQCRSALPAVPALCSARR
jgi:SAM-dependent methyltransferase